MIGAEKEEFRVWPAAETSDLCTLRDRCKCR